MIMAAAAVLLLASCGSDDNANTNNEESIAGSYILTELNTSQAIDLNDDGVSSTNILDEVTCLDSAVVFSANGTYTSNTDEVEIFTTVDSDGNEFTTVECFGPFEEVGTFSIEGNVITITPSEDDGDFTDLGVGTGSFTFEGEILTITNISAFGQVDAVYQRQ